MNVMTLETGFAILTETGDAVVLLESDSPFVINGAVTFDRITPHSLLSFENELSTFNIVIVDENGDPINLAGHTVKFTASDPLFPLDELIYHDNGTAGGLTVSGVDSNDITLQFSAQDTAIVRDLEHAIWDVTDNIVLGWGELSIIPVSQ